LSWKAITLLLGLASYGATNHLKKVTRHLLTVDHQAALEEPVTRVLAVGLGDVEALDVRRVAADAVDETGRV